MDIKTCKMIKTKEQKTQWKMAIYTWSFTQNFDNWWFWIRKNKLLYLINEQNDIVKIYLYARDLEEPKYKVLIKKCKDEGIKHLNDPNAFIECSNTMDDTYENIHDYNSSRRRKILFFMTWSQTLWEIKHFKP